MYSSVIIVRISKGYVKDLVSVPPLPPNLKEMKEYIVPAVLTIDGDVLQTVWHESEYRIDVCLVTREAHIEHL
jgi:hypothetical protein